MRVAWLCLALPCAAAWGRLGHQATGAIAQKLLTPDAARWVDSVLDPRFNGSLARAAPWPDTVRRQYPWASHLHYIDTGFNVTTGVCILNMTRDCAADGCVVTAIRDFTNQLLRGPDHPPSGPHSVPYADALAFLVHFIGDLHNPLHVLGMDRGGNSFPVKFTRGRVASVRASRRRRGRMNMHRVWDGELINKRVRFQYANSHEKFLEALWERLDGAAGEWHGDIPAWSACEGDDAAVAVCKPAWSACEGDDAALAVCPAQWAQETGRHNCKTVWNGVTRGAELGGVYYELNAPLVERLLAQAAVRIASVINWIVTRVPSPPPPQPHSKMHSQPETLNKVQWKTLSDDLDPDL